MSSTGAGGAVQAEDLPLPKISERYKDRWVAIVVTERDRNAQPVKGRVVADDVDRYRLREKTAKYDEICFFYAGDSSYRLLL
jgi:hypothetical protein